MAQKPGGAIARILERATSQERSGDWQRADASYHELFRAGLAERDAQALTTAARRRSQIFLQRGSLDHAGELADLSREIAERCGLDVEVARALNVVGMVRFHARDYTGASSAYSEAIEVARSAGEDRTVIHATRNLGAVLENGGDSANAKALYLEGIAASLREHDPRSAASLYIHLGTVARTDCEWMEAELHYRRAVELAELAHDVYVAGIARVELAVPLIEMGEVITAGDLLNECERTARSSDNYAALAAVNRIRGKLALRSGRRDDAEMHFNEALGTSTTHNLTREKAEVLEDIGHLRQLQNRPILAKSAWREALEIFRELGAEGSVARLTQLIEA